MTSIKRRTNPTAHYARVGGISLVEMNLLEKEFLNVIDWRLMVCPDVLSF